MKLASPRDKSLRREIERIKRRAQALHPSRTIAEVNQAVEAAKLQFQESENGEKLMAAIEKLLLK